MKRVVSVSLGSKKGDKTAKAVFLGEEFVVVAEGFPAADFFCFVESWSCWQVFGSVFFDFAEFHGFADLLVNLVNSRHGFYVPLVQNFLRAVDDDFSACFPYVFDLVEVDFGLAGSNSVYAFHACRNKCGAHAV